MSELSDAAETLVLQWLLGIGTPTQPAAQFLALTTGTIVDANTGSNLGGSTEISGNGYARQAIAFDTPASPGGTSDNSDLESYTASGGNWGTITYVALCDAVTTGGCIVYSPMTTSRQVDDTDTLEFAAGSVVVTAA